MIKHFLSIIAISTIVLLTYSPAPTHADDVLAELPSTAVTEPLKLAPVPTTTPNFGRREALIASLTIFALAVFVGFELITKVPPTLHTPLMSGSNAISGITLVGAVLTAGSDQVHLAAILGLIAVILATINVVGGFLVTDRMLEMFRKK